MEIQIKNIIQFNVNPINYWYCDLRDETTSFY